MSNLDWRTMKHGGAAFDFEEPDPVWLWLGTYVTGIPDPIYPWHLDDVMAIRRMIGNDFIPITRRVAYRSPSGGEKIFVHLGLGVHNDHQEPEEQLQGVLMPTWAHWPKPTRVGLWFEPAEKMAYGLPGRTIPWGDWVVQMAREARNLSAKEAIALAEQERQKEKLALKHVKEETAYKAREEAPYQKRLINSMSSSELVELGNTLSGTRVEPYEPKPYAI